MATICSLAIARFRQSRGLAKGSLARAVVVVVVEDGPLGEGVDNLAAFGP